MVQDRRTLVNTYGISASAFLVDGTRATVRDRWQRVGLEACWSFNHAFSIMKSHAPRQTGRASCGLRAAGCGLRAARARRVPDGCQDSVRYKVQKP